MKRFLLASATLCLVAFLSTHALCAAALYQVIALGTLGGNLSQPYGLNNRGEVSGCSSLDGTVGTHAFYWHNNTMIDANPSGYPGSYAYGINDKGCVVGMAYMSGQQYAFMWNRGIATVIGSGYACAINNSDEIVGYSGILGTGEHQAFVYRNGATTSLGADKVARGINDAGQIVGESNGLVKHAVMWQGDQMICLPDLGGRSSSANDVNAYGESAGYSSNAQGEYHAALWRNGTITDLGMLGGYSTYAKGINKYCQVVGFAMTHGSSMHGGFLWQDGALMNLNTLIPVESGWRIYQATDINDSGQIIGYGSCNGVYSAVLLNPVPEPSSLLALLCGIGRMGGTMWRRKSA